MAKTGQQKTEALRLYKKGVPASKIATKLKVSARTVQRWIKTENLALVEVVGMMADRNASLSTPKDIEKRRDNFDAEFSFKVTARLLRLTESVLDVVEETLNDPDTRRSDKLGAAKLVGDWVGLKAPPRYPSGAFISVPHRIGQVFTVPTSPDQSQP